MRRFSEYFRDWRLAHKYISLVTSRGDLIYVGCGELVPTKYLTYFVINASKGFWFKPYTFIVGAEL